MLPNAMQMPHPRMQTRPRKLTKLNIFNFEIWVLFDFNNSRIIFYVHIVKTGATFYNQSGPDGRTRLDGRPGSNDSELCNEFGLHMLYILYAFNLYLGYPDC